LPKLNVNTLNLNIYALTWGRTGSIEDQSLTIAARREGFSTLVADEQPKQKEKYAAQKNHTFCRDQRCVHALMRGEFRAASER
jgi:hypothetical protein